MAKLVDNSASGISSSHIAKVEVLAKALIVEKAYTSVIEKVGLPFFQSIIDATGNLMKPACIFATLSMNTRRIKNIPQNKNHI